MNIARYGGVLLIGAWVVWTSSASIAAGDPAPATALAPAQATEPTLAIPRQLEQEIQQVRLDGLTVRQALVWWSDTTRIPLHIDVDAAERDGLAIDRLVNLKLDFVPASQVLGEILQAAATDQQRFIAEITPWYVKLQSRKQANRQQVLRVYLISDFLIDVPNFDPPASLSLTGIRSDRGQGTSQSIFQSSTTTQTIRRASPQERAEKLQELIQQMVEPDVWSVSGGESTISVFQNQLIIKAPTYVHDQIGPSLPMPSDDRR